MDNLDDEFDKFLKNQAAQQRQPPQAQSSAANVEVQQHSNVQNANLDFININANYPFTNNLHYNDTPNDLSTATGFDLSVLPAGSHHHPQLTNTTNANSTHSLTSATTPNAHAADRNIPYDSITTDTFNASQDPTGAMLAQQQQHPQTSTFINNPLFLDNDSQGIDILSSTFQGAHIPFTLDQNAPLLLQQQEPPPPRQEQDLFNELLSMAASRQRSSSLNTWQMQAQYQPSVSINQTQLHSQAPQHRHSFMHQPSQNSQMYQAALQQHPQYLPPPQQQHVYQPNQQPLQQFPHTTYAQHPSQQRYPSQQYPQQPPQELNVKRRVSQPLQQQKPQQQMLNNFKRPSDSGRRNSSNIANMSKQYQASSLADGDEKHPVTLASSSTTKNIQRRKSSTATAHKGKERRDSSPETTTTVKAGQASSKPAASQANSNSSSSTNSTDNLVNTNTGSNPNSSNLDVNLTALMKQVEEKFMIAGRNTIPSYRGRLYKLEIVQQPNRARMCGCGDKDRRPISPPPILKLTVMAPDGTVLTPDSFDPTFLVVFCDSRQEEAGVSGELSATNVTAASSSSSLSTVGTAGSTGTAKTFGTNASSSGGSGRSTKRIDNIITFPTTRIDDDGIEREISQNLKNLVGNAFASAQKLYDPDGRLGIYFVFHDISLRAEGIYHLNFSLMHLGSPTSYTLNTSSPSHIITQIKSQSFAVYTPKRFPGVADSTELSKCFARQGVKIPIRKEKSSESSASNSPAKKQQTQQQQPRSSSPLLDEDDYNSA